MSDQIKTRDKRLPQSEDMTPAQALRWADTNDLRWQFILGYLFTPERPEDPEEQLQMMGEGGPSDESSSESVQQDGPSGSDSQEQDSDEDSDSEGQEDSDSSNNDDHDEDASGDSSSEGDEPDSGSDGSPDDNGDSDGSDNGDSDSDDSEPRDDDGSSDSRDSSGSDDGVGTDSDGDEDSAGADSSSDSNGTEDDSGSNGHGDSDGLDDPEPQSEPKSQPRFGWTAPPIKSKPDLLGYEFVQINPNSVEFRREFRSWRDFVECAADDSLYAWTKSGQRSSHETSSAKNDTFYATNSFDEAVQMALYTGWPEGREMLSDSLATIVPTNQYVVHHEMDVAGSYPVVPFYCAGDPACMINIETETHRQARPIIRIDYNHMNAWYITPKTMMNRGAAVLSLALSLEAAGYATELRIIANTQSYDYDHKRRAGMTQVQRYSIVYKEAGEPLDLDRAAFALAHPSCMRRLGFAIMEQVPEMEYTFGPHGYGSCTGEPNDPTSGKPGGAIFIPPVQGQETPEQSKAAVEKAAADLIAQLTDQIRSTA